MLGLFKRLLGTVPFSAEKPGLMQLTIRALEPTETPVIDHDLRPAPATPAELVALAGESAHVDSAYETWAFWDLWTWQDAGDGFEWQLLPQRIELTCFGEGYDDGAFTQTGHFQVDLGFEHFFTGHAGLLGFDGRAPSAPEHPLEAEFLRRMAEPARLATYRLRTQENIRKLTGWMNQVREALPIERYRLWSEGEENFEARLDEIAAAR